MEGAVPGWPRMGGDLWRGQEEAAEIVALTVEHADRTGRLRGILDAVRSHRVVDDFSAKWSYAREDFERKLHHKRNKIAVKFVELPDTVPVQGPETEVEGRLVFADFMALLDEKEQQIVILLSSGYTKLTDIAAEMGYANHSPISKKLARIRRLAQSFLRPALVQATLRLPTMPSVQVVALPGSSWPTRPRPAEGRRTRQDERSCSFAWPI